MTYPEKMARQQANSSGLDRSTFAGRVIVAQSHTQPGPNFPGQITSLTL